MSHLPQSETISLNRELSFLKQTISSLRDQLERNLELHECELGSLETEFKQKRNKFTQLGI